MSQFQKYKQNSVQQQNSIGRESDISLPQPQNKEENEEKIVLIREIDEQNNSQQYLKLKSNQKSSVISQGQKKLAHQHSSSSVQSELQIKQLEEKYSQHGEKFKLALDQQGYLIDKDNFMEKIYEFMNDNTDLVYNIESNVLIKSNVGSKGHKAIQDQYEKKIRKHVLTHKYKANLKFAIKRAFYKIWFENAMKSAKQNINYKAVDEGEGIQVNYFLENNMLYERTKSKYQNEELENQFLETSQNQKENDENKIKSKENQDAIPTDELRIYIPYSNNIYMDQN